MSFGREFRVITIDDDAGFLTTLGDALRNIGITSIIKAVGCGEARLKLGASDRPTDCILCNYAMEDGTGLQLLQEIRLGRIPRVRADACFVLMTKTRAPDVVQAAKALDINGYLIKPITGEKLKDGILKARARVSKVQFDKYLQVVVPAPKPAAPFGAAN